MNTHNILFCQMRNKDQSNREGFFVYFKKLMPGSLFSFPQDEQNPLHTETNPDYLNQVPKILKSKSQIPVWSTDALAFLRTYKLPWYLEACNPILNTIFNCLTDGCMVVSFTKKSV